MPGASKVPRRSYALEAWYGRFHVQFAKISCGIHPGKATECDRQGDMPSLQETGWSVHVGMDIADGAIWVPVDAV